MMAFPTLPAVVDKDVEGDMSALWLVEDESAIADALMYALQGEGFSVRWFDCGLPMLEALQHSEPQLIILDIGLPDINGFEVCRRVLRQSDVPIIFLTARSEEVDKIAGLEMGADEYISKPFSIREVCARVRMVLRRYQKAQISRASIGRERVEAAHAHSNFEVRKEQARVLYYGIALSLTRYEYLLLTYMLQAPERIFTRELLMEQVWHQALDAFDRTVDTHIKTLRQKLRAIAPDQEPIVTHRGLGYSVSTILINTTSVTGL